MENKKIFKCKIIVEKVVWESYDSDFKIFKARFIEGYEGYPSPSHETFSVKGECAKLIPYKAIYVMEAEEIFEAKYGLTYKIIYLNEDIDVENVDSQRIFLNNILGEKICNALFEKFPNPLKAIKEGRENEFLQINGIGPAKIEKIKEKLENNKSYGTIVMKLGYEIPHSVIKALINRYKSADLIVEKIKDNPYILTTVKGVGFKKADEIALKEGIPKSDPKRIKAFINQIFIDCQDREGHLWLTLSDLICNVRNSIDISISTQEIVACVKQLIQDKTLFYDENNKIIGLNSYYTLEKMNANEIKRLMEAEVEYPKDWREKVAKLEESQGWNFNEEQLLAIETSLKNPVTIITGKAGCVDCDTEFFNGERWKKISEYQKGDKVLQYHTDGSATLCYPLQYVKKPETKFTLIKTQTGGINQCLSDEHNVVYMTSKGNLAKRPFYEIKEKHLNSKNGFYGKFITTFSYNGDGIDLTNEQLRLMVAIIADGHYTNDKSNYCSINIKKDRKIKRIEKLLKEANIEYYHGTHNECYHFFNFYAPIKLKHFPKEWYNCSQEQLQIISEEVIYWDGTVRQGRTSFTTTNQSDAEFIQFVFSATGYRSTISVYDRRGEEIITNGKLYVKDFIEYEVRKNKDKLLSIVSTKGRPKASMTSYSSKDGFKYCFTVPTNMLVLRRNGRIFITGNTGKSSTVAGILYALPDVNFGQCALSGKAANRLTEVTNFEGETIHRMLKFNGEGFEFNKNNPLPYDMILLDESSMVGGDIYYRLLSAINTGSRLIMLGDIDQLDAIGIGSTFKDFIFSKKIPVINLTKIMRQAEKSGIITTSISISQGQQITDPNFKEKKVYGELQDFELDCTEGEILLKITEAYKKFFPMASSIMELQFITPLRERGQISSKIINTLIQNLYNPQSKDKEEISLTKSGFSYILREGDKVINRKNNYKVQDTNGRISSIYNGNIGIIELIDYKEMIINFEGIGRIVIPKELYPNIELAYCITCHLAQGSQYEYVIYCFDMSSYVLLNKEQVYTGVSRAKIHCLMICPNKALQYAIRTSKSVIKHTWLKNLLKEK